mgnify:CR=1 FL=1
MQTYTRCDWLALFVGGHVPVRAYPVPASPESQLPAGGDPDVSGVAVQHNTEGVPPLHHPTARRRAVYAQRLHVSAYTPNILYRICFTDGVFFT